jgi:hypothetical protein
MVEKIYTSSEAQQGGEKLIPLVRSQNSEKKTYVKMWRKLQTLSEA